MLTIAINQSTKSKMINHFLPVSLDILPVSTRGTKISLCHCHQHSQSPVSQEFGFHLTTTTTDIYPFTSQSLTAQPSAHVHLTNPNHHPFCQGGTQKIIWTKYSIKRILLCGLILKNLNASS